MRDRAVDLIGIKPADFRRRDRRAENPEHRPGVKAARHHGRDELGGHPLHDLITGGDAGQKVTAGTAARLGRRERSRQDCDAGMGQHAEGVPLAAGEDCLGIDKGGAGLGQLCAVTQHRRGPSPARLFLLDQRERLATRRHPAAEKRRR